MIKTNQITKYWLESSVLFDPAPYSSEEKMQQDCFMWHWNTYPEERRMLFHVQNNMFGNAYRGSINKGIGVVKGISDMVLILSGAVVFIEMKLPSKTQQDEQKDFEYKCQQRGHVYLIIRSFTAFKYFITLIYRNGK